MRRVIRILKVILLITCVYCLMLAGSVLVAIGHFGDKPAILAIEFIRNQNVLKYVVRESLSDNARLMALSRITDQFLLRDIVMDSKIFWELRDEAIEKIKDNVFLMEVAMRDENELLRSHAIHLIHDQGILYTIATNSPHPEISLAAVDAIHDQNFIEGLAKNASYTTVRKKAVEKLTNQILLAEIARKDPDTDVRKEAVYALKNQNLILQLAKTHPETYPETLVSCAAVARLEDKNILKSLVSDKKNWPENVRECAVEHIHDEAFLLKLAQSDSSEGVRKKAMLNLEKMLGDEEECVRVAETDPNMLKRLLAIKHVYRMQVLEHIAVTDSSAKVRQAANDQLKKVPSEGHFSGPSERPFPLVPGVNLHYPAPPGTRYP